MNVVKSYYYKDGTTPSFVVLHRSSYFQVRTVVKDVGIFDFSEWGCSCIAEDVKIDDFNSLESAMDYLIDNDVDDDWDDGFDRMSSYPIDVNSPADWKDFL